MSTVVRVSLARCSGFCFRRNFSNSCSYFAWRDRKPQFSFLKYSAELPCQSFLVCSLNVHKRFKHGTAKKGKNKSKNVVEHSKSDSEDEEVDHVDLDESDRVYASVDDLVPLSELKNRFSRVVEGLKKDLAVIRSGRIDPAMFDHLTVHSYGQEAPLSSVAQVSVKGPQLIVLTCYDPATAPAVTESVRNSGMDLNPQQDGNKVSVPIPKMSHETRENMIKVANKSTEKAKVHIRGIRHKYQERLKSHKDAFSSDDVHRHQKEIDALTSTMETMCAAALESKKKELL